MKKLLIVIGIFGAVSLGALALLTIKHNSGKQDSFRDGGYVLNSAAGQTDSAIGKQYYFNGGTSYSENDSAETISFKTIDGESVSIGKDSFIHYNDDSMQSMSKSVLYDTDQPKKANYYSIPGGTVFQKSGDGYTVDIGGQSATMKNMVWKLSDTRYMVVSDTVELVLSDTERQTFPGFVQVDYSDSGIVYLTTQQGVYSTVSSDAYLQLQNGIRIYLGSKNVSTDDAVISNISQLVVNNQDLIEPIPDKEFNNTSEEKPQIVVEASNGKNGEDGEEGEKGEDGENGETGKPGEKGQTGVTGDDGDNGNEGDDGESGAAGNAGTNGKNGENGTLGGTGATGGGGNPGDEGDPGDPGKNSTTANVTYQEAKMPTFWFKTRSDCYSLKTTITYDDHETQIDTATTTVTLYESSSGLKVASKTPGPDIVKATGFDVVFDELNPGTNYTMVVTTDYTTVAGDKVSRDVATAYCATESVGMALVPFPATDTTLNAVLSKTSESGIASVIVKLYDKNQELINGIFMKPAGITYDAATGEFSVADLPVNGAVEMSVDGLTNNTAYFAKIVVTKYKDTVESQNQKYTFPLVALKTLKIEPQLEAPWVELSGAENAFVVSPKRIQDPDNGIVSYRYEIYRADMVEAGSLGEPVWTVNAANASSVKAPIDGEHLATDIRYRARVIALFDNNEQVIDYASPFSDPFWLDSSSAWPIISFTDPLVSPSTAEGEVTVFDASNVLLRTNNKLHVEILPHDKLYKPNQSGTTPVEYTDPVYSYDVDLHDSTDTRFVVPYKAQGLVNGTRYDIRVSVDMISINGKDLADQVLGTSSFTTEAEYIPLKINSVPATGGEYSLKTYIYFTSSRQDEDDAKKTVLSNIEGVTDMSHFSSKSMQYLKLQLSLNGTVYGTAVLNLPEGYAAGKDPSAYRFIQKDASSAVLPEKKSLRYKRYWDKADTSELNEQYCIDNEFGIQVILGNDPEVGTFKKSDNTVLIYDDLVKAGYAGEKVSITAEVYDYTYMTGGKDATWVSSTGTVLNRIQCEDRCDFVLGHPVPVYSTIQTKYEEEDYKKDATDKLMGLITRKMAVVDDGGVLLAAYKAGTQASNYWQYSVSMGTLEDKYWNQLRWGGDTAELEMKNGTAVGLRILGPVNGLKSYARRVRYTVYTSYDPADPKANIVNGSEWLDVPTGENTVFPSWDFLLGAESNATRTVHVRVKDPVAAVYKDETVSVSPVEMKRGDTFYVKVEIEMNAYYCSEVNGTVYPSDYIGETEDPYIKDVTGPVLKKITIPKQIPAVSLVQWSGNTVPEIDPQTGNELPTAVTHLLMINDMDEAFLPRTGVTDYKNYRTDFGKIAVFKNGIETKGTELIQLESNSGFGLPAVFPLMLSQVTNKAKLSLQYDDASGVQGLIELNGSYNLLITGSPVTVIDSTNSGLTPYNLDTADLDAMYRDPKHPTANYYLPVSLEDGKWSTFFYYDCADYSKDLARVDLELTGYPETAPGSGIPDEANPGTPVRFSLNAGNSDSDRTLSFTDEGYSKGGTTPVLHKAAISLNVLASKNADLANLSGYEFVKVTVNAFYDSGNYGLSYVDEYRTGRTGYYSTQSDSQKIYVYQGSGSPVSVPYLYEAIYPVGVVPSGTDILKYDAKESTIGGVYYDKTAYKYQNMLYSANGLSPLPREVGTRLMGTYPKPIQKNLLSSIMPSYLATVDPGYSEARITLTMGNLGDVGTAADGMFAVYYQKKTAAAADQLTDDRAHNEALVAAGKAYRYYLSKDGDPVEPDPVGAPGVTVPAPKYDEMQIIRGKEISAGKYEGLQGNKTEYAVRAFARASGIWHNLDTKTAEASPQTVQELSFKTLERIIISWGAEGNIVAYLAGKENAKTGKKVRVNYTVREAYYSDIVASLKNVTLGISGLTADVSTNQGVLELIKEAFPKDTATNQPLETKQTYIVSAEVNWEPDSRRIMNGLQMYTLKTVVTYNGGETDQAVMVSGTPAVPVYTPTTVTDTPEEWETYAGKWKNGNSYLKIVAAKGYDAALPGSNKGTFKISITGYDYLRLFRLADDGKDPSKITSYTASKYHIVLCEKDQDGGPKPIGEDWAVVDIPVTINADGTVMETATSLLTASHLFSGLESNKDYMAKIYIDWDNNNNDRIDVTAGTREQLVYETQWYRIPDQTIQFTTFTMHPNPDPAQAIAKCSGVNLEYVTMVSYTLKVNTVTQLTRTLKSDGTGDTSWDDWQRDIHDSEVFNLRVEGMTDTSAAYELVIKVYGPSCPNGIEIIKSYGIR